MSDPKPPTRAELSAAFKDPRTVKAFEGVFDVIPSSLDAAAIEAALASAKANANEGELIRLANALQALATMPIPIATRHPAVDYVDFSGTPPHADQPRRVVWNDTDDTLNLHHSNGVTQQVGLETYARVINNTGALIPNGSVVGFDGAASGTIKGKKYIANGTFPVDYLIGIATEDIANGGFGKITVFGMVREIDTSALAVGDLIYASPTVAGAYTATKPSPPAYSIPLGFVVTVGATTGSVFVRPIIEMTRHFGAVLKTTNQTPAAINTAYAISFDSTALPQGVSIGSPSSRIVVSTAGLYNFNASYQLTSTSASVKNVWLWARKNGVDVADSSLKVSLESGTAINTQHRAAFFSLGAGEYVELMFAADNTNVALSAIAATGFAPAAPACVVTVTQVQ